MKLFLFNNDEKLIGTVSPLEGIQNEEINKIQTIECTVVYSELIEKASYIGHKDYSDNRIFHLYKIDHVTKTSTTDVKIVGVHTFFDDMESDGYVKDFRPTNRELVGVLTTILDGSRWQLGTVNIQRRYTGNFYYVTRKEAISKLIEATQIEIKPRLEFSRGKITGRYLDVFTRLGGRNGKVFVHGRDLLTVSEKKSQGAIYTAVVGRGKGEETDTGGYGRRISFKDVEWRRTSGQPVDKPVGQEYVEIPAMTKLYGFEKGTKPRIKIVEFQDETDKEKLLRLSYEWLEKNSRMQVEYSAKVLNVGNLELGDTVGIFNPKLGIKYETRVFKVKRNLVNNKLTEFGIGDKVTTSPFSRTIELAKEMKNFQDDTVYWLDKIRERLSDKLINEDGYNYDLKADNEYKVPAGYYSFDKPIDQNPTKVVYTGAGKIAIANSKKPTGEWNWKTFLDGRGATLDLINTGVLRAGRIQSADGRSYWDLDTGEFHMEQSAINEAVKTAVSGKVQEIVGEVKKNLPTKEELKGKSSYLHKKYSDYPDGRNMSDNSNLKYIGIYTGDKQQAPTNASEYSWTKIRGEDGARGRDGNNGRDGVSNYIHRKYSDNANGSPMSDNSNLKYIGIYTGTSATAPTTPTSYTWSKIKGEDGAQGVPGARGSDGRTSYLHTAYSNSATGDRDFSTTNSINKEYIGTYTDFEINDSNDYRRYKWVKIKGENGRDGNNGRDGRDGNIELNLLNGTKEFLKSQFAPPDSWQRSSVWVDEIERYEDFAVKSTIYQSNGLWQNVKVEKGKTYEFGFFAKGSRDTNRIFFSPGWASSSAKQPLAQYNVGNVPFNLTTAWKFYSFRFTVTETGWSQCRVEKNEDNNGIKISLCGLYLKELKNNQSEPLGWSPSIEDLQGHTLTANVRFEGTYINNVTNNLRVFLDVYYDGRKIASGFNAQVKFKGGLTTEWSNFWNANVDSTGRITNIDWGNREQNGEPIDVIVLVTYKDKDAIASARTDNTPNIGELKETIQRYKTFESTLSEFRSEIGYVKETTQILGDTVPDILKDSRTQTGNDIYFNSATPLKANTWYTIVADISGLKSKQETGIYGASGNTSKPILNSRNFWVVKFPSEQNRVNFYPLGTNTTIKNVRVYEGDFTETLQGNLYVTHSIHPTENKWLIINLNKKLDGKDIVLYFDVDGDVNGKKFNYSNFLSNFSAETDVEFPLKNKDNVVSLDGFANSAIILTFNYANPTIKNVRVYEVDYAFRKLTKTQTQNIGTVFKQSAEDIIIAWNNYNKYFSFNNETLDILEKDNYQNQYKKISLTSEGLKIYNNNTLIGTIGTFTHLGQSFRQNTLDIILTEHTKAFGVYTWVDTWAFDTHLAGYQPLFEIKIENGNAKTQLHAPTETGDLYIGSLNIRETGSTYARGVTKTINVGGRYLKFVQGILVSG